MTPSSWTVRTRLALLYAALFLFGGAALLGVTLTSVRHALMHQPVNASIVRAHLTDAQAANPNLAGDANLPTGERSMAAAPDLDAPDNPAPGPPDKAMESYRLAEQLQADYRRSTLNTLVTSGTVTLGGIAVVGAWLGWLVAGRTLRPIQQITATARRVADRSLSERVAPGGLSERVALDGPRDELRELADTFDDMLGRLDAAFDNQRRFVANASHELRTPLAINRTLIEVAAGRADAPPQMRRLCDTLLEVNTRQQRLIDGLLLLARSERAVVDPVPTDLAEITGRLVDAARSEARPTELEITELNTTGLKIEADLVAAPTVADQVLLERLVQNLLQNAIRYNVAGGWVRLACGPTARGVRLTVVNTGPVVGDHEVAGLFEPFRRLRDRVGSAQGSGLGLSIAQSIARAHEGDVTAVAREGGGLTVTVTLPDGRAVDR